MGEYIIFQEVGKVKREHKNFFLYIDLCYSQVGKGWKTLSVGHCLKVISRIQE